VNEKLKKYLDGEIGVEDLAPEERSEAEAWGRLFRTMREASAVRAPGTLLRDVMSAVEEEAAGRSSAGSAAPPHERSPEGSREERAGWARALGWLVRPVRIPVPPVAALAAAALVALVVWPSERPPAPPTDSSAVRPASLTTPETGGPQVYVELSLRAGDASSVAVAGDFTDWRPTVQLRDPDGDGVWTALVPVGPGVHQYMFVVDGSRWVTDPDASRYVDDGFGHRNAVLAISPPAGT